MRMLRKKGSLIFELHVTTKKNRCKRKSKSFFVRIRMLVKSSLCRELLFFLRTLLRIFACRYAIAID